MNTYQARVADQLTSEPQERLFEVIVGFGGNIVVLKVLFSVESDGLCFDLALLDIDFVSCQDDGDVLANANKVAYVD